MSIFAQLHTESVVQVGDKTRLNGSQSFAGGGANLDKIEIEPEEDAGFIEVTGPGYLDWVYAEDGDKTVTVKVTRGEDEATVIGTVSVITAEDDNLYSGDAALRDYEAQIMDLLPQGRSSYLNYHRRAQSLMLAWLEQQGFVDANRDAYTSTTLTNTAAVRDWSTFLVLRLIFEGVSNATNDVFSEKAKRYRELEEFHRERVIRILDGDGDDVLDQVIGTGLQTTKVVRR